MECADLETAAAAILSHLFQEARRLIREGAPLSEVDKQLRQALAQSSGIHIRSQTLCSRSIWRVISSGGTSYLLRFNSIGNHSRKRRVEYATLVVKTFSQFVLKRRTHYRSKNCNMIGIVSDRFRASQRRGYDRRS